MTSDGLPVAAGPPLSEVVRQRGIAVLQELFARGQVDEGDFHGALDGMLRAGTEGELGSLIRRLPPPVPLTAPDRRRREPLEIASSMGEVRLEGPWQVGYRTKISAVTGAVVIDLTEAEFDDWEVEIVVHTGIGAITVIAPPGLDVRLMGRNGPVTSSLEPSIPGFPVVRLSATSDVGTIRLVHPAERAQRRKRWRRRGRSSTQT